MRQRQPAVASIPSSPASLVRLCYADRVGRSLNHSPGLQAPSENGRVALAKREGRGQGCPLNVEAPTSERKRVAPLGRVAFWLDTRLIRARPCEAWRARDKPLVASPPVLAWQALRAQGPSLSDRLIHECWPLPNKKKPGGESEERNKGVRDDCNS